MIFFYTQGKYLRSHAHPSNRGNSRKTHLIALSVKYSYRESNEKVQFMLRRVPDKFTEKNKYLNWIDVFLVSCHTPQALSFLEKLS